MFVKRILNYAFSHNVQQMTVTFLPDKNNIEFPLSLFSSQSLKHLALEGTSYMLPVMASSTWELPALTTTFDDVITDEFIGLFSKCPNLKDLTLSHCSMENVIVICHPGLSNLTLENGKFFENGLNLVAPQLKNLIIIEWSGVYVVSAPKLTSLLVKGSQCLQCSPYSFCSLEKVDLCISKLCTKYKSDKTDTQIIVALLQQLHNAKFLALNLEIIKLLFSFKELISNQPSPFANLESLKVYPRIGFEKGQETIPTEVKIYLLDGSPSATFTMVSYEEMRALENAELAQNLMAEFQMLLEKEKANITTNRATMELGRESAECQKAKMHEHKEPKIDKWGRMSEINSCWKEPSVQIEQGKSKTRKILSKLRHIESLVTASCIKES